MVTWSNLDTLASYKELPEVKKVDLAAVMSGENGAERVKKYSIPMAAGLSLKEENVFGLEAKVCNISVIGLRHNKYSSAFGAIKYFDAKLSLRGRTYNMISDNDKDSLISTGQKVTVNGNIVSRLVGNFFDN